MQHDLVQRFYAALPGVRRWVEALLREHADRARPLDTSRCPRLPGCYPAELLARTRVVTVPQIPFPPLDRLGLPELADFQQMPIVGITFPDTVFLQHGQASESVYFHELVHVVQWARLGVDRFLLAYGLGLVQAGYDQSPLERMAYSLQQRFDKGDLPPQLVQEIETQTDALWDQVARTLQTKGTS